MNERGLGRRMTKQEKWDRGELAISLREKGDTYKKIGEKLGVVGSTAKHIIWSQKHRRLQAKDEQDPKFYFKRKYAYDDLKEKYKGREYWDEVEDLEKLAIEWGEDPETILSEYLMYYHQRHGSRLYTAEV